MTPLTSAQAAAYLHISLKSFCQMAATGTIPAAKIGPEGGKEWVTTAEALDAYLTKEIAEQTERLRKPYVPGKIMEAARRSRAIPSLTSANG